MIFSVLKRGGTPATANYQKIILYQRTSYGSGSGSSKLLTSGSGSFHGAPDYEAFNSDTDTRLQITNVPANLITVDGGLMYVTEVYTRHTLITPFHQFGVKAAGEPLFHRLLLGESLHKAYEHDDTAARLGA